MLKYSHFTDTRVSGQINVYVIKVLATYRCMANTLPTSKSIISEVLATYRWLVLHLWVIHLYV